MINTVLSFIALVLVFIAINLNNMVSAKQETNILLKELATQIRYLKESLRK